MCGDCHKPVYKFTTFHLICPSKLKSWLNLGYLWEVATVLPDFWDSLSVSCFESVRGDDNHPPGLITWAWTKSYYCFMYICLTHHTLSFLPISCMVFWNILVLPRVSHILWNAHLHMVLRVSCNTCQRGDMSCYLSAKIGKICITCIPITCSTYNYCSRNKWRW